MDQKKLFIHTLGVFITITAIQAFTVKTGFSGGWLELAKGVLYQDLLIKLLISLLTGFIIVKIQRKKSQAMPKKKLVRGKNGKK
ncbi:hypothetical protein [Desulforamulus ruminis]|uniref:Uncharacterized protein n=1 Tax=Desulforamulus ruminis (strain ATCC 23193 / DSM 2154 / NCIMB 8452 / DL) TaxID=696281 RepID=F6DRQ3_DESRL|nr:hypothetical protein [Desulforamulus ruminis]AEG59814.1 hypothetical protein Desru_1549 [Desulforamulus ruminis DSM 2154]